ncbi:hypothetical protein D3C85_1672780 [compost metagenome]
MATAAFGVFPDRNIVFNDISADQAPSLVGREQEELDHRQCGVQRQVGMCGHCPLGHGLPVADVAASQFLRATG